MVTIPHRATPTSGRSAVLSLCIRAIAYATRAVVGGVGESANVVCRYSVV